MATKYTLYQRGKIWYYKLHGEKTFHTTGEKRKRDAREKVESILEDGGSRTTFRAYARNFFVWGKCEWIKTEHALDRPFSKATAAMRRGHLENHIFPQWGETKLSEMNAIDIEAWIVALQRTVEKPDGTTKTVPLSSQTKNHVLNSMNIILRQAKRERVIKYNPIDDVRRVRNVSRKRDVYTLEELKKLFPKDQEKLIAVWGHLQKAVLFYTVLTAGLRRGEVGALLWRHVDLKQNMLLIEQAIKADGTVGPPKNGTRATFIPNRTTRLLEDYKKETPFPAHNHYVFFGDAGDKHLNVKTISDSFNKGLKNAGIERGGRYLDLHSLRHTYNTRMENVLPEAMLRFMIGHKTAAMTERYKNKTPEEQLLEFLPERNRINSVF